MIVFVTDPADPRLEDYRALKERHLDRKFVAESEVVVRKLLASGLRVHSMLLTAPRLRALEPIAGDFPVYVVPQEVMDGVAGFHVHRGCLAIGERPTPVVGQPRTVVALEDLVAVDNLGAIVRNAAGFGVDAILLSPRCADPFYRKAIRVSAGAVFNLPIVRATRWPDDLLALRLPIIGAVLDTDAVPLASYAAPERWALLLGAEGPGLSAETKRMCDARVTIPMTKADSLNVATASAVFLYHLTGAR